MDGRVGYARPAYKMVLVRRHIAGREGLDCAALLTPVGMSVHGNGASCCRNFSPVEEYSGSGARNLSFSAVYR